MLEEQQKISTQKIEELFHFMKYKKSSNVVKETMLQVRENNKKAKKAYTTARSFLELTNTHKPLNCLLNILMPILTVIMLLMRIIGWPNLTWLMKTIKTQKKHSLLFSKKTQYITNFLILCWSWPLFMSN